MSLDGSLAMCINRNLLNQRADAFANLTNTKEGIKTKKPAGMGAY